MMTKSQTQKWQADMSRGITPKTKVQCTCRIRLMYPRGAVVYCSSQLATQLKNEGLTTRMEMNVFVPLKDMGNLLQQRLRELAQKSPDQFAKSSLVLIN